MVNKNDKEELLKLIKENPKLPIVFFAHNDDFILDYGETVFENYYCYIATIYIDEQEDDTYYVDIGDILKIWRDRLCDEDEYKDLSDEDYDKTIEKYVKENVIHYEAIVVSMRH